MSKVVIPLFTLILLSSCLSSKDVDKQEDVSLEIPQGYVLLWEDLFDGTSLDLSTWNIEEGGSGFVNAELQKM